MKTPTSELLGTVELLTYNIIICHFLGTVFVILIFDMSPEDSMVILSFLGYFGNWESTIVNYHWSWQSIKPSHFMRLGKRCSQQLQTVFDFNLDFIFVL